MKKIMKQVDVQSDHLGNIIGDKDNYTFKEGGEFFTVEQYTDEEGVKYEELGDKEGYHYLFHPCGDLMIDGKITQVYYIVDMDNTDLGLMLFALFEYGEVE